MFLRASAVSHVGNVREHNEDNYCFLKRINNLNENGKVYQISRPIFNTCFMGVFDGMGGISAGEKASFIAANTARDMMPIKNMSPDEAMLKVCDTANSAICREMQSTEKLVYRVKNADAIEITPFGVYVLGYSGEGTPRVNISYTDGSSYENDYFELESVTGWFRKKRNFCGQGRYDLGEQGFDKISSVSLDGEEATRR